MTIAVFDTPYTLLAIVAGIYGFLQLRILWAILRTKTASIGGLREGLGEIKGDIAKSGGLFTSPVHETRCVYYSWVVSTQGGISGRPIVYEEKERSFVIDDGTGQILVNPTDAKLILSKSRNKSSGKLTPEMERALRRYPEIERRSSAGYSLSYAETVLEPGREVYVLGSVQGKKKKAYISKKPGLPFIISDRGEGYLAARFTVRALLAIGLTAWAVVEILHRARALP